MSYHMAVPIIRAHEQLQQKATGLQLQVIYQNDNFGVNFKYLILPRLELWRKRWRRGKGV